MNRLKQFFRDTNKLLIDEYERSKNLNHSTLKGNCRELFLTKFLRSTFPQKFVIGTGEIIDSKDEISKQADIIIYDELMPTFDYGGSSHYLSGGVLSHIEVKSNLDKQDLIKALSIAESVKTLERDIDSSMHFGNLPKSIFSSIFAFESSESSTIKKHMDEYYSSTGDNKSFPDLVCVLNEFVILKNISIGSEEICPVILDTKEDSLLIYFLTLYTSMYKNWSGVPNLKKYAGEELTYKNISNL